MIASISDSVPKLKLVSRVFLDYLALTKPRVMSLLLFTAVGGAFVAARGIPPWQYILPLLIGGALASGGASALNMWYEEDIDQEMHRTDHRPVAGGRIKPMNALIFGILLNAASFAVLYYFTNVLAAALALAGSALYVVLYTAVLNVRRHRTSWLEVPRVRCRRWWAMRRSSEFWTLRRGTCSRSCFSGRRRISGLCRC